MPAHRHRHLFTVGPDAVTPHHDPDRSPLRRAIESDDYHAYTARGLADVCGGVEPLENLELDPLGESPFDWASVPTTDRPLVTELLHTIEPFSDAHLDDEYRTILRRLVALAAAHPEHPLRRRAATKRIAAALVWIALKGNLAIGRRSRWNAEDLWDLLGVTNCADLARSIAFTMRITPSADLFPYCRLPTDPIAFGDPALLHSRTRKWLVTRRDEEIELIRHTEADREARKLLVDLGGGRIELRGREVKVLGAVKGTVDSGRATVMVMLGESRRDPDDVLALSVPDARALVADLQSALNAPLTGTAT